MRWRLQLAGAVQGVGFRPFVYRLAQSLDLRGFVCNTAQGALIEVEGCEAVLEEFRRRLDSGKPAACWIAACELSQLDPVGFDAFRIESSGEGEGRTAFLLPDLASCPQCLEECRDPAARRFGYAFTNCTNCGPRYTIIEAIPYDRPNTTMAGFPLCADCGREYRDPADRRFHAQPVACPACGPRLSATIAETADALRRGGIVALKGIGGFQLLCDAASADAVARLRQRKQREEKPFAVMFPSLTAVERCAEVSPAEAGLLTGPAAPIVLLRARRPSPLADNVCGASPYVGAMLPYSPLHHLLLAACGFPLVATSGNRSEEPIAIDDTEARERLGPIADLIVTHDRPIARACDDSVVRLTGTRETVLRRARGYAPLPVLVRRPLPRVLAVGAHLKNAVAIALGRQVHLSQHIGDLETVEAYRHFERTIQDLCRLYNFEPELVACDLHPDYASTRHAESLGGPLVRVQHHLAHVAACAAENDVAEPYLGVAWDGTGYGTDGVIWGSEFFLVDRGTARRIAHLEPFRLPGGDQAARDGTRTAFSLLQQAGLPTGGLDLPEQTAAVWSRMIERGVQSPWFTSAGRLFDAVAALCGVARRNAFEGQAPMLLEAAIEPGGDDAYPVSSDWTPLLECLLAGRARGEAPGVLARRFHNGLVKWIRSVAAEAAVGRVVLSGGCFQNAYLAARTVSRLEGLGIECHTHQRVPPNDGGIALGQAVVAGSQLGLLP